jgi:uncharacterized membrane protein YgcG
MEANMRNLTLLAALFLSSLSAFAKYYEAEDYDTTLRLDSRGDVTVTETVVFRFVAGPFRYVFRDIATNETDGIEDVQAWMDGRPCASGTGPGEVEIRGSSPVTVRWHFEPVLAGTHTFKLQYRAAGLLRPGRDSQTLVWRVLPRPREYQIGASRIVVEYPAGVEPRTIMLRPDLPRFEIGKGRAQVQVVGLPMGMDLLVNAEFPAGSFAGMEPGWQAAQERLHRDLGRGERFGAAISVIFLALACWWMFPIRAAAKPRAAGLESGAAIASPPSSLPPAQAGWLLGKPALSVGTLLDLASRGVLRIEEAKRGFLGARRFQVAMCGSAAPLAPHESVLLQLAFREGETSTGIQDFFSRLRNSKFVSAIRSEAQAAGFVDETRVRARRVLLVAGGLGLAAGLALFLIGIASSKHAESALVAGVAGVLGVAVFGAGLLAIILGAMQRIWSDPGVIAAAQWKAFADYLGLAARGRAALPGPGEFERFLPYAGAFGVCVPLLKRQEKEEGIALPPWFQAIQSAADGSDAAAFVAFMGSCDSSASGGHGGAGAGGDGGASGGGASGAG